MKFLGKIMVNSLIIKALANKILRIMLRKAKRNIQQEFVVIQKEWLLWE
jgi:hypothetical protein